jgi:hypothetical protein
MKMLFLGLLAVSSLAIAQEEYRPARIIDASSGWGMEAGAFGDVENAHQNSITIELDGMRYTAQYNTLTGGKNSAANFIVGAEVQARVHDDRQIWILREDGKPLKIRITRREIVQPE